MMAGPRDGCKEELECGGGSNGWEGRRVGKELERDVERGEIIKILCKKKKDMKMKLNGKSGGETKVEG